MDLHKNCIGCSEDGFIFKHFSPEEKNNQIVTSLKMDKRMEGWEGIPHGGIGMGTLMEVTAHLANYPVTPETIYPLSVNIKMGGAKVKIGDTVNIHAQEEENGASAEMSVDGNPQPYITLSLSYRNEDTKLVRGFHSYLPEHISELKTENFVLPRYRNCFVCGTDRVGRGLKRKFELASETSPGLVIARAGFHSKDEEDFYWCRRGNMLHPLAVLSLLDETMGWGGFLLVKEGGVSVRFNFIFLRDIRLDEKIIVFGKGEKKKGDIKKHLMFWSSGGVATVKEDGRLEMVAAASAQFLALPELTEQMRQRLSPEDTTQQVFALAGQ